MAMAAPLNDFETISPRKLVDTETTRPSPTPCIILPDRAKGRFEEDNVTKSHPKVSKVNAVAIVGFLPNVSASLVATTQPNNAPKHVPPLTRPFYALSIPSSGKYWPMNPTAAPELKFPRLQTTMARI